MNAHGGTTETSVTFSLAELMKIEQERLAEQEQQRRLQAEQRENAERERRMRLEREASEKLRAEEQARREQEQRERTEAARLEAMRHAVVEAERERALQQARIAQAEHEREHQRKLTALQQNTVKRRLKAGLVTVSVALSVFVFGGASAFFGVIKPQTDRRIEQLDAQACQREQDNAQLKRKLEAQSATMDKLMDQVRQGQLERSMLTAKLDEAMKELERRGSKPVLTGGVRQVPTTINDGFARNCTDPNDPMCLGTRK